MVGPMIFCDSCFAEEFMVERPAYQSQSVTEIDAKSDKYKYWLGQYMKDNGI
jgi:hypothetical protein